jgi:hypothetical protein
MTSAVGYHGPVTAVPPQATPERLTEILRHAGVLGRGEVVDVAVDTSRETLVSRIARLRLAYAGAADGAPSHVFFKAQREDVDSRWHELGRKETAFYAHVAAATRAALLPRCYEAVAEPAGPWHLLLEDLTASHEPVGQWPMPPSIERCRAVAAAHARFHAAWWDDGRLGVSVGAFADEAGVLDRFVAALPKEVAAFADRLGDRLSGERRAVYERLIAAAPRLLGRYRSHRHLTVVHGDAHVWNALLSRGATLDDVRLIDWDGWRVDMASDDLAYMLALHWYPDWRRRHERDVLARYHETLMAEGVRDYSFDALWQDYRYSVLWQITTPLWQAAHALAPVIWWNNLERVMLAVNDLGCLELLE